MVGKLNKMITKTEKMKSTMVINIKIFYNKMKYFFSVTLSH